MLKFAVPLLFAAMPAFAQGTVTHPFDGSFEEATFGVESAIIDQGLAIDFVSHVGGMLNRTAADVGSDKQLFEAGYVFLFYPAVLSRKVMEADPLNIAHCPYGVFATEIEGMVTVGCQELPDGPMKEVQARLDVVAPEAVGG